MPRQTIEGAVVRLAAHAPEPRPADVGEPRAELEAQQPEDAEDHVGVGPRVGHDLDRCQRGLLLQDEGQDEGQEGEAVAQRARHHDTIHTDSGRRTRLGFLCGREAGRLVHHEARRRAMARVADHLSVDDLEARLRSAQDPTATRHFQVIWLLARGHTIADVAAVTSFVPRWIEQLLARYNAHGPEALGDLRRRNGSAPSVLRPELLARLPERLATPPSDGGLWTGPKVAAWMASELGLTRVAPQRGWEALKAINWSVQKPRPRHPAAATPEECETFKKSWPRWSRRKRQSTRTNRLRSGPRTSTASA